MRRTTLQAICSRASLPYPRDKQHKQTVHYIPEPVAWEKYLSRPSCGCDPRDDRREVVRNADRDSTDAAATRFVLDTLRPRVWVLVLNALVRSRGRRQGQITGPSLRKGFVQVSPSGGTRARGGPAHVFPTDFDTPAPHILCETFLCQGRRTLL